LGGRAPPRRSRSPSLFDLVWCSGLLLLCCRLQLCKASAVSKAI
jgi:hypothetical protein